MWSKRAFSLLLSCILVFTALPLSSFSVYAQDNVETEVLAGDTPEGETEQEAAGGALAGDVEEDPADSVQEGGGQTDPEGSGISEDDAQAGDSAQGEDGVQAGDGSQAGDSAQVSDGPQAGQDDGQILEDEDSRGAEEEAESGRDGAEDSQGAGDAAPADGAGSTSEDGVIEDTDTSDAGQEGEAPREGAAPREVTSQEEALEEESENAMADGETVEYHIGVSSVDGKMIAFPGQEITLAADACRIEGADIVREGFLYKWEIVDGNDDGMISFKNGIEGQIGDYPTATLVFSGEPNAQVCDQDPEAFHYTIKVRATLYDGEDENGIPVERTSGEIEGIQLRDEYFEITPLEMEQIRLGEEVELPLSILYYSYYFANENGGMRYGYNVSWAFEYDENVLRVTDKDGNPIDPSGQAGGSWLSAVEDGGTNEIRVKIRRVSAGFSDFRATARFSYIDHNGTYHDTDGGLDQATFGVNYAQWNLTDGDELTWFRDDDKTVYTDAEEAPSFVLNTDRLGDDWQDNLEIDVAVSAIEDGVDQPLVEDNQYTVSDDGTCVTLSLDYLNSVTADTDVWVHARTYIKGLEHNDENKVSEAAACFRIRLTEENYENSLEGDCEMLPGWDWNIEKRKRVRVRNTAHPDGDDEFFEVTGIRSSDEDVVGTYVSEDENDEWPFHYKAKAHGEATITVSYTDLNKESQEYSFKVYVKEDVYGVSVFTKDGSDRTLPGKSIHLKTRAWHHSEAEDQQGVTDGLTYVWNLKKTDGQPDPDQFASLQPSEDGRSADVSFQSIVGDDGGFWHEVDAEVFIYNGAYSEENPEENKVGYDCIRLVMADQYMELWPAAINSRMEVGDPDEVDDPYEVDAQLRFYPGTGENGFDLAENVHYYWYYEDWKVRVDDVNGKQVGNEDDQGQYQDSEASTGSSCRFSIYRLRQADTEIILKACWKDGDGNDHWEERKFRLDEMDYKVSLDDRGDNRVFSDGNKTIDVRVEGIPENAVYGTDYQIRDIAVGLWSDADDGDGREIKYPYPNSVWSFDPGSEDEGMTLTLHGGELKEEGLKDDQDFGISMLLSYKGVSLWVEEGDFRFKEARADYHDKESDRDMLPGWDGHIGNSYRVRVFDAEHPDGWETSYRVKDVQIVNQDPAQEGKAVITLDKSFKDDDSQSEEYWWDYKAQTHGSARLCVTFQDVLDTEKDLSYDFDIYVKSDVYRVDAWTQDGTRYMRVLPGARVGLSAQAFHESEDKDQDGNTDDLIYAWEIVNCGEDGNPQTPDVADFASISWGENNKSAYVTFRDLNSGETDVWYDLDAVVSVFKSDDMQNPVATDSLRLTMADSYLYIEPASIRGNLAVGQEYPVTAKLLSYSVNGGSDPVLLGEGEGNGSVHYFWYYDSNAVQILDEEKNQVGNEDENGDYNDSEKSTGPERGFTIRPLKNQDTDISLEACWTDENGEEHWGERRDYHLSRVNYDIWFDEHDVSVYTDAYSASGGPRPLSLNTGNLASLGDDWAQEISLDLHVGHWDDENEEWTDELTEGTDYTVEEDGDQIRFTLTQSFIEAMAQAFQEQNGPDYDGVRLVAEIYPKNLPDEDKTEENRLADTDAWFHVHVARAEYEKEGDRVMLPGWDGTVKGFYEVRLEDTEHPDGWDGRYRVVNVEKTEDNPQDPDGGPVVEELHRDQKDGDENDFWWYYRVRKQGDAELTVTYQDLDGSEKQYSFHLYVGDHAYSVYMDSMGHERNAFPGAEIELYADAHHEYFDENGDQQSDAEGLDYQWVFENGEQYAEIVVHEDDHSRATLRFNTLPQGRDRIDKEVRVGVRVLNAQGEKTEGYDSTGFWVLSEYTEVWPLMLDRNLEVGQSISDQKFEVRRYVMGRDQYEVVDPTAVRYEWHYDENVMSVTEKKEEDGKPVEVQVRDGETALTDTFSIRRKGDWDSDYSVRAFWTNDEGKEEDCHGNYQLWRRDYSISFREHDETIYTDAFAYKDSHQDFEIPLLVLDIGSLGKNPEEKLDIVVTAGNWKDDNWAGLLSPGDSEQTADYVLKKEDGAWKVSLTRDYLEELGEQSKGADIRVLAEVYLKGAERTEENRLADTDAWFHVRVAREEYEKEKDRTMLPGWEGVVRGSYNCHVENSELEDGEDIPYKVTNVEVLNDRPLEGEGGSVVDELNRVQNKQDANAYWWEYRVEHRGQADLKVTYQDIHGTEKTYVFKLSVGNDVYEVYMDSTSREYMGLPGKEIELSADAVHKYLDENGEHQEDNADLGYAWSFEYGAEYAVITVHNDDPSKATLRFNDLPEGKNRIDQEIRIGVRIRNKEGNDTEGYDARNFWVRSEYTEIWPRMFDPGQNVGEAIEDQKFEVRRYMLGQNSYEVIDPEKVRYEWHYDENALAVTEKKDGDPVPVHDGDTASGDTFTLTRKGNWNHDYSVRACWENEDGDEEEVWADYQLWEIHYDYEFLTGNQPVEDNEKLRDDEEKTYALDVQNLGGFGGDIFYVVDYRAADSKEQAGDLLNGLEEGRDYFVNEEEGGAVFVNLTEGEDYAIDYEGNTLTVYGDMIEQKLLNSVCSDQKYKQEFYIGALLFYQGRNIESRWNRILFERTGKSIQNIQASDVALTMFDQPAISVTDAMGTLTYKSSDESIVKVSEDGKLIPVAEGSAVIGVKASATEDYRPGRTSFTATVGKLSLGDEGVSMELQIPAGGYTYDGAQKKPAAALAYKETALGQGSDFTVSYSSNINAGTARVTVTGRGHCKGTITRDFTIKKAAVTAAGVTLSAAAYTYDGKAKTPAVTVKVGGKTLKAGTDYTAAYTANTNAGTAKVTVTGKGNYSGSAAKTFTINKAAVTAAGVTLSAAAYTYDGKAKTPAVTVKVGGKTLKAGTDYTVSYTANTNAGTAKVTVTGKGNYSGTVTKTFTIKKAAQTITGPAASYSKTYGDKAFSLGAKARTSLSYASSNTKAATVSSKGAVTIKGIGTTKITITAAASTNYNKATKTVTVTVKYAPTISVKTTSKTYTASTLGKASQSFSLGASVNSKGKLTYKKTSGSAAITVGATNGKITVKKGTKKGTYTAVINVTAAANGNYWQGTKKVTVKITVK